jgi:hypothetical protein
VDVVELLEGDAALELLRLPLALVDPDVELACPYWDD